MIEKMIIAHRGACNGGDKENSLKAFENAIAIGVDMIEFDVRKTRDGVFLIHHNSTLNNKLISRLSYHEILAMDRSIPTLEETLILTKGRVKLDIELKEEGDEKEVVEMISRHFDERDFVITSFKKSSLTKIKRNYPSIRVGLILGKENLKDLLVLVHKALRAKIDILVPHWILLRKGFFPVPRKVALFVWTVNREAMIRTFMNDNRVKGIITDRPQFAVSLKSP
jgi:glycerophosphoryl diester phosphodiesterase